MERKAEVELGLAFLIVISIKVIGLRLIPTGVGKSRFGVGKGGKVDEFFKIIVIILVK